MKHKPVIKIDKGNTSTSKILDDVTPLSFFQFMANLQPSGSRLPDTSSIKLKFSLKVTFYSTEPENETKSLKDSFYTIALSFYTIFAKKNADFLQEKC